MSSVLIIEKQQSQIDESIDKYVYEHRSTVDMLSSYFTAQGRFDLNDEPLPQSTLAQLLDLHSELYMLPLDEVNSHWHRVEKVIFSKLQPYGTSEVVQQFVCQCVLQFIRVDAVSLKTLFARILEYFTTQFSTYSSYPTHLIVLLRLSNVLYDMYGGHASPDSNSFIQSFLRASQLPSIEYIKEHFSLLLVFYSSEPNLAVQKLLASRIAHTLGWLSNPANVTPPSTQKVNTETSIHLATSLSNMCTAFSESVLSKHIMDIVGYIPLFQMHVDTLTVLFPPLLTFFTSPTILLCGASCQLAAACSFAQFLVNATKVLEKETQVPPALLYLQTPYHLFSHLFPNLWLQTSINKITTLSPLLRTFLSMTITHVCKLLLQPNHKQMNEEVGTWLEASKAGKRRDDAPEDEKGFLSGNSVSEDMVKVPPQPPNTMSDDFILKIVCAVLVLPHHDTPGAFVDAAVVKFQSPQAMDTSISNINCNPLLYIFTHGILPSCSNDQKTLVLTFLCTLLLSSSPSHTTLGVVPTVPHIAALFDLGDYFTSMKVSAPVIYNYDQSWLPHLVNTSASALVPRKSSTPWVNLADWTDIVKDIKQLDTLHSLLPHISDTKYSKYVLTTLFNGLSQSQTTLCVKIIEMHCGQLTDSIDMLPSQLVNFATFTSKTPCIAVLPSCSHASTTMLTMIIYSMHKIECISLSSQTALRNLLARVPMQLPVQVDPTVLFANTTANSKLSHTTAFAQQASTATSLLNLLPTSTVYVHEYTNVADLLLQTYALLSSPNEAYQKLIIAFLESTSNHSLVGPIMPSICQHLVNTLQDPLLTQAMLAVPSIATKQLREKVKLLVSVVHLYKEPLTHAQGLSPELILLGRKTVLQDNLTLQCQQGAGVLSAEIHFFGVLYVLLNRQKLCDSAVLQYARELQFKLLKFKAECPSIVLHAIEQFHSQSLDLMTAAGCVEDIFLYIPKSPYILPLASNSSWQGADYNGKAAACSTVLPMTLHALDSISTGKMPILPDAGALHAISVALQVAGKTETSLTPITEAACVILARAERLTSNQSLVQTSHAPSALTTSAVSGSVYLRNLYLLCTVTSTNMATVQNLNLGSYSSLSALSHSVLCLQGKNRNIRLPTLHEALYIDEMNFLLEYGMTYTSAVAPSSSEFFDLSYNTHTVYHVTRLQMLHKSIEIGIGKLLTKNPASLYTLLSSVHSPMMIQNTLLYQSNILANLPISILPRIAPAIITLVTSPGMVAAHPLTVQIANTVVSTVLHRTHNTTYFTEIFACFHTLLDSVLVNSRIHMATLLSVLTNHDFHTRDNEELINKTVQPPISAPLPPMKLDDITYSFGHPAIPTQPGDIQKYNQLILELHATLGQYDPSSLNQALSLLLSTAQHIGRDNILRKQGKIAIYGKQVQYKTFCDIEGTSAVNTKITLKSAFLTSVSVNLINLPPLSVDITMLQLTEIFGRILRMNHDQKRRSMLQVQIKAFAEAIATTPFSQPLLLSPILLRQLLPLLETSVLDLSIFTSRQYLPFLPAEVQSEVGCMRTLLIHTQIVAIQSLTHRHSYYSKYASSLLLPLSNLCVSFLRAYHQGVTATELLHSTRLPVSANITARSRMYGSSGFTSLLSITLCYIQATLHPMVSLGTTHIDAYSVLQVLGNSAPVHANATSVFFTQPAQYQYMFTTGHYPMTSQLIASLITAATQSTKQTIPAIELGTSHTLLNPQEVDPFFAIPAPEAYNLLVPLTMNAQGAAVTVLATQPCNSTNATMVNCVRNMIYSYLLAYIASFSELMCTVNLVSPMLQQHIRNAPISIISTLLCLQPNVSQPVLQQAMVTTSGHPNTNAFLQFLACSQNHKKSYSVPAYASAISCASILHIKKDISSLILSQVLLTISMPPLYIAYAIGKIKSMFLFTLPLLDNTPTYQCLKVSNSQNPHVSMSTLFQLISQSSLSQISQLPIHAQPLALKNSLYAALATPVPVYIPTLLPLFYTQDQTTETVLWSNLIYTALTRVTTEPMVQIVFQHPQIHDNDIYHPLGAVLSSHSYSLQGLFQKMLQSQTKSTPTGNTTGSITSRITSMFSTPLPGLNSWLMIPLKNILAPEDMSQSYLLMSTLNNIVLKQDNALLSSMLHAVVCALLVATTVYRTPEHSISKIVTGLTSIPTKTAQTNILKTLEHPLLLSRALHSIRNTPQQEYNDAYYATVISTPLLNIIKALHTTPDTSVPLMSCLLSIDTLLGPLLTLKEAKKSLICTSIECLSTYFTDTPMHIDEAKEQILLTSVNSLRKQKYFVSPVLSISTIPSCPLVSVLGSSTLNLQGKAYSRVSKVFIPTPILPELAQLHRSSCISGLQGCLTHVILSANTVNQVNSLLLSSSNIVSVSLLTQLLEQVSETCHNASAHAILFSMLASQYIYTYLQQNGNQSVLSPVLLRLLTPLVLENTMTSIHLDILVCTFVSAIATVKNVTEPKLLKHRYDLSMELLPLLMTRLQGSSNEYQLLSIDLLVQCISTDILILYLHSEYIEADQVAQQLVYLFTQLQITEEQAISKNTILISKQMLTLHALVAACVISSTQHPVDAASLLRNTNFTVSRVNLIETLLVLNAIPHMLLPNYIEQVLPQYTHSTVLASNVRTSLVSLVSYLGSLTTVQTTALGKTHPLCQIYKKSVQSLAVVFNTTQSTVNNQGMVQICKPDQGAAELTKDWVQKCNDSF